MVYESSGLQQKALSCIPHVLLRSNAKERLKQAKDADPGKITFIANVKWFYRASYRSFRTHF